MRKQLKKIQLKDIAMVVAIVMLILVAGCIGQEKVEERKRLIIAMPNEPDMLDTQQPSWCAVPTHYIVQPVATIDMEGNIVPDLVESFDIKENGNVITWHLPKDYKFSDGAPIDALALKDTFLRFREISPFGDDYATLGDLGMNVLDDTTLECVCSKPPASAWAYFTSDYGAVFNVKVANEVGLEEFGKAPVASGPFKLVEWVHGSHVLVERNDNYKTHMPFVENKGPPAIDEIMFRFVPEDLTRVSELEAGTADIITNIPGADLPRIRQNPDIHVLEAMTAGWTPIVFNLLKPPFDDVRVRGAIYSAIDREAIVETLEGTVEPRYSFLSPNQLCYSSEMEEYAKTLHPFSVEGAKAMLADAGWTDTDGDGWVDKDGQTFSCNLVVPTDDRYIFKIGVVIQAQLQTIGIDCKVETYEFDYVWTMYEEGNADISFSKWAWLDPGDMYYAFADPSGSWFVNDLSLTEDVREDLSEARYIMDIEERTKVYSDIQKALIDRVVAVPIFTRKEYFGVRNWVEGIVFHPGLNLNGAGMCFVNDMKVITITEEE